jgi:formylglycine-generating enzyme required for sulfatase activity
MADGGAPAWASAWGEDQFGIWAAFTLTNVTQKLRWIPPGQFTMGSPDGEPGRYESEGPAHAVALSDGYWLFDTPVTQALWSVVMDNNPSVFQSPDRPVDGVSWHDVQTFLAEINAARADLALALPTEAQWEYACRAGTESAIYSGDIEILGDANAPALDLIAWYGGNSGVDFDLENGMERSWLKDMQYPTGKAGTHPVALKAANPWGLYDMLGNVWEWCADGERAYRAESAIDPAEF